jgi:hypothetical protein
VNTINRRRLLIASALGLGSLPLRSLITGLPIPLLMGASSAAIAAAGSAQFLILSHMTNGDPLNVNVPGTYPSDPNSTTDPLRFIQHATVTEAGATAAGFQTPSSFTLGNVSVKAAAPWANLPSDLRQNMAFWHHGTFTNTHSELPVVRRLGGVAKGYDGSGVAELGSLIAEEMNATLGTVGKEILTVGGASVQSGGREMSVLNPINLKGIFVNSDANIQKMIASEIALLIRHIKTLKA